MKPITKEEHSRLTNEAIEFVDKNGNIEPSEWTFEKGLDVVRRGLEIATGEELVGLECNNQLVVAILTLNNRAFEGPLEMAKWLFSRIKHPYSEPSAMAQHILRFYSGQVQCRVIQPPAHNRN